MDTESDTDSDIEPDADLDTDSDTEPDTKSDTQSDAKRSGASETPYGVVPKHVSVALRPGPPKYSILGSLKY